MRARAEEVLDAALLSTGERLQAYTNEVVLGLAVLVCKFVYAMYPPLTIFHRHLGKERYR